MSTQKYAMYAKFYDRLNHDYQLWHSVIDRILDGTTEPGKMIEFGCGTGNILQKYAGSFSVYGVDISKEMIEQATNKLPGGKFYIDDMVTFSTSETFDVALCLFDSINHVLDFNLWSQFFKNVASMLSPNGVFIIDANTTTRLRRIVEFPPLLKEFDSNYMIMKLLQKSETNFVFDVRVLTKVGDTLFREESEQIEETTRSGSEIYSVLEQGFSSIEVINENGIRFDRAEFDENERYRWIFVCRR